LARAIAANHDDLTVDLSEVTFIDAGTIGALISGRNRLHGQSRSLRLRSPSGSARRVLEACGLTGLIDPG
jgi:anti-anti-sigma factor